MASEADRFEAWAKVARERVEPFAEEVTAAGWDVTTTWAIGAKDPRVTIVVRPRHGN